MDNVRDASHDGASTSLLRRGACVLCAVLVLFAGRSVQHRGRVWAQNTGVRTHGDPQNTKRSAYTGPEVPLEEAWRVNGAFDAGPVVGPEGTVYGTKTDTLYALGPDGHRKWTYVTGGGTLRAPKTDRSGTLYAGYDTLRAIGPDGTKEWHAKPFQWMYSPTVAPDGTIYVSSRRGEPLVALSPEGKKQWQFGPKHGVEFSPTVGPDGRVYVSSFHSRPHESTLFAIGADGDRKWRVRFDQKIAAPPVVGDDGTVYVVVNENAGEDHLHAVGPQGTKQWAYDPDREIPSSPAIGPDGVSEHDPP